MIPNLNKVLINQAVESGLSLFKPHLNRHKRIVLATLFICLIGFVFGVGLRTSDHGDAQTITVSKAASKMSQGDLMEYAYEIQKKAAENPDALFGLNATEIELMLAKPDLQRKDYPSVAWQYRSNSCVVDVFYTTPNEGDMAQAQVQHFEMRSRNLITADKAKDVDSWACMQSLYSERQEIIEAGFSQIFARAEAENSGS